jgi:hypothetical protein
MADDLMEFPCPACGARLRAPHKAAGREGRCTKCQKLFIVPAQFVMDGPPPAASASSAPAAPMINPFQRLPPPAKPKPDMWQRIRTLLPMAVVVIVLGAGGCFGWSFFTGDEPERTRAARHAEAGDQSQPASGHAEDRPAPDHPQAAPGLQIPRAAEAASERVAAPAPPAPPAAPPPPPAAAQPAPGSVAAATPPPAAAAASQQAAAKPAEPLTLAQGDRVACPECAGEGSIPCPAHCNHGKLRCPASCLKKDDPGWMPGQEGKTWMLFPSHRPDGSGGHMWSTLHIGQLIVYENGVPVNKGICPTCKGTSVVDCKKCDGKGSLVCPLCQGRKTVGTAEAEAYLAALAAERQKNAITLSDGRVLHGKIIGKTADKVIIQTEDGKTELVDPQSIVSAPANGAK